MYHTPENRHTDGISEYAGKIRHLMMPVSVECMTVTGAKGRLVPRDCF
jgi:hypothetical protein